MFFIAFRLAFFGKERVLVERIDARVRGLLNVLVAPVGDFVDVIANAHLFGKDVHVKSYLHVKLSFDKILVT